MTKAAATPADKTTMVRDHPNLPAPGASLAVLPGRSLVRRLTALNLLVLSLSLLLSFALIGALSWSAALQRQHDAAELGLKLLANSLAPMVAFEDRDAARAEVAAFARRPDLLELRVLSEAGETFAVWTANRGAPGVGRGLLPLIEVWQPIEVKGERIGRVMLRESLGSLARSLLWLSLGASAVILLAILIASYVLRLVQRRALAPIVELGALAEQVAADHDYGRRAAVRRLDEVGRLALRFNEMLGRIQLAQEQLNQRLRQEQAVGAQFQQLAHHDSLTQLPNRRFFEGALAEMVEHSRAAGQLMALMFIDLDHFKRVNDSHGHEAGDQVLQVVARRMSSVLRGGDLLCRIGGDEFALLLPALPNEAVAETLAARLIVSVREPLWVQQHLMPVGATIGLAFFPLDAQSPEVLLARADAAMYAAKGAGRNCFRRVDHAALA